MCPMTFVNKKIKNTLYFDTKLNCTSGYNDTIDNFKIKKSQFQ